MKTTIRTLFALLSAVLLFSCIGTKEDGPNEKIASVSIQGGDITLYEGESKQLEVVVLPAGVIGKTVIWSSSDECVAVVSSSGKIIGVSEGNAVITAKAGEKSDIIRVTVSKKVLIEEITLVKTEWNLFMGETWMLSATIEPSDASIKSLKWDSTDDSIATVDEGGTVTAVSVGHVTIKAEAQDGSGKSASCEVEVKQPFIAVKGSAVDMGLSVKWMSFNLGATKPEEYGEYFAWGETDPKSDYSWDEYKWCNNGSYHELTKYNNDSTNGTVDNITVLEAEDDAATKNLGANWRIPTDEEWTELRENCIWTWTTQNGVSGYKVTSTKTGYTNKYIFLPAAGRRDDTRLVDAGSRGHYWSSSLQSYASYRAWRVFYDEWGELERAIDIRSHGSSIRPVTE